MGTKKYRKVKDLTDEQMRLIRGRKNAQNYTKLVVMTQIVMMLS